MKLKILMSHRKPLDVELTDVLYVPDLECNLISVKQLTRNGWGVIFRNEYCSIIECNEVFTVAKCCNGLYKLNIEDHRSRRSYKANLCVLYVYMNGIPGWHTEIWQTF